MIDATDESKNWWTMTPGGYDGDAEVWGIRSGSGALYSYQTDTKFAVHPVINLKADTKAIKNENGHYVVQ